MFSWSIVISDVISGATEIKKAIYKLPSISGLLTIFVMFVTLM